MGTRSFYAGRSTIEEIHLALNNIGSRRPSRTPAILEKAKAICAEIERDAQARRNCNIIAAIFGGDDTTEEAEPSGSSRSATRPGKSAGE